jgi:hypothetical protein
MASAQQIRGTPGSPSAVEFPDSRVLPLPTRPLSVDGQQVAHRALPRMLPFTFAWDETLDVGMDTGTPVDDNDYQVPFAFTGRLNRITVDIGESSATPEALRALQARMQQRN